MLDLCYEARDIEQATTSEKKVDQWFDANTEGLTDLRGRNSSAGRPTSNFKQSLGVAAIPRLGQIRPYEPPHAHA
jgi:hypothetical protein